MANLKGCGRKIGLYKVICAEFVAWAKEEARRIERGEADRYHAVLCDPPYGLEFMSKEWDSFSKPGIGERTTEWPSFTPNSANPTCAKCGGRQRGARKCDCGTPEWKPIISENPAYGKTVGQQMLHYQDWTREWVSALIPLFYPGALVFCFGGTRTWHRLACGFEDAGFQIWDTINYCSTEDPDYRCGWLEWYHGSGFPKAQEIGRFFCQCNEKNSKGNRELLDVRAINTETAECKKEKQGLLLQQGLCAKSPSCANDATNGRDRCDGVPRMDRSGQGDLAQEDDWQSKPGVEGRGNVLPQAWELQADQVCPLPAELSADGTEGRLCNGAPTDSGAANGSPAPTQGNRTSCESRSAGQRADESRTLARQPDPQTMGARCPRCGKTIVSSAFRESLKGFKTAALKPSHEPVLCFKAPTQGKTYAELALEYGSGALNVDGGRIAGPMDGVWGTSNEGCAPAFNASPEQHDFRSAPHNAGRYPANLALECTCEEVELVDALVCGDVSGQEPTSVAPRKGTDYGEFAKRELFMAYRGKAIRHTNPDCPCFQLDAQAGERQSGQSNGEARIGEASHGAIPSLRRGVLISRSDSGGPSRFFYCAKASRGEREAGLENWEPSDYGHTPYDKCDRCGKQILPDGGGNKCECAEPQRRGNRVRNNHPTVKPLALCRWLATLLLPPPFLPRCPKCDTPWVPTKEWRLGLRPGCDCIKNLCPDVALTAKEWVDFADEVAQDFQPLDGKPRRLLVPFSGSGSEMIGALQAGWDEVVGIEQDVHYCEIARARIAHAEAQPNLFEPKLEQLEFVGASGN